ncbi:hypothetical protein Tco_0652196, partial [Tanacetum coccineum]
MKQRVVGFYKTINDTDLIWWFFLKFLDLVQNTFDDEPGHNHEGYPSGGDVVDLTGDEDLTDEDGDIGMGDSTGVSVSLGGEIFSGGKKSWESTSGQLLWKTVLSWRIVEFKFNGKITVVTFVRELCPHGK